MSKKYILIVACFTALIVGAFFFLRKTQNNSNDLVIGMMSGWAPFMSVNEKGEFEGFDVDVANELAKRMGKKPIIKDVGSLASCFIALEQNKIQMIFSGLDITQKRLETMQMVPYVGQGTKEYYLVFWKEIPQGISKLEDLKKIKNATVCVEPGNSTEKFIDRFDYINKKSLACLADIILDLQYGKSLAAVLEPQVVKKLAQTRTEIKYLSIPLPLEFQVFGCGIALKKENIFLKNKVEAIIRELKDEGFIQKLEAKWSLTGV